MKPTIPPIDSPDHLFHDGDDATQRDGTELTSVHLNNMQAAVISMQDEIVAVLTQAGITPAEATQGQLLDAITKVIAGTTSLPNLTNVAKAVTFAVSPKIPTATLDDAPVTFAQLKLNGGGYTSQVIWHHSRANTPDGYIPGDGQVIAQATAPDLYALVLAGKVPQTTEAIWQADPGMRGCYTIDPVAKTIRLPDYNGMQNGSRVTPVMVGGKSADQGTIKAGSAPNIKGNFDIRAARASTNNITTAGIGAGGFCSKTTLTGAGAEPMQLNATGTNTFERFLFDASVSSAVYKDGVTDITTNRTGGVWLIRFAGMALNAGSVDALTQATQIADLQSKVSTQQTDIDNLTDLTKWRLANDPLVAEYLGFNNNDNALPTDRMFRFSHDMSSIDVRGMFVVQTGTANRNLLDILKLPPGYSSWSTVYSQILPSTGEAYAYMPVQLNRPARDLVRTSSVNTAATWVIVDFTIIFNK